METNTDHKQELEKICARAKRGGLLRASYPEHGIAILAIPPAPAAEASIPVTSQPEKPNQP